MTDGPQGTMQIRIPGMKKPVKVPKWVLPVAGAVGIAAIILLRGKGSGSTEPAELPEGSEAGGGVVGGEPARAPYPVTIPGAPEIPQPGGWTTSPISPETAVVYLPGEGQIPIEDSWWYANVPEEVVIPEPIVPQGLARAESLDLSGIRGSATVTPTGTSSISGSASRTASRYGGRGAMGPQLARQLAVTRAPTQTVAKRIASTLKPAKPTQYGGRGAMGPQTVRQLALRRELANTPFASVRGSATVTRTPPAPKRHLVRFDTE